MNTPTPSAAFGHEWVGNQSSATRIALRDEADEAALARARQGIETYRKGGTTLRFEDASGQPVPGVEVRYRLERHEFTFGCPMADVAPAPGAGLAAIERARLFRGLFNCGSALCYWDEKWDHPIEREQGVRDTAHFLASVEWAIANGLRVKGHPLVWTVPKAIPTWMTRYDYATQMKFLETHVRSMISCARGRVGMWDLCNEMLWEPSLRHLPQRNWPHIETVEEILTYLEPAMRWAREEQPEGIFSINEYGLEGHTLPVDAATQRRRLIELVEEMKKRGVAPDAIGTQAHIGWHPPAVHEAVLNELATAGIPIQVTEFWVKPHEMPGAEKLSKDELSRAHAESVLDFYTLAFGHPALTHISYWGFEDFLGEPTFMRVCIPNETYLALQELLHKTWWSDGAALADACGRAELRGFHGRYSSEFIAPNGRTGRFGFDISSNASSTHAIRLP